MNGLEQKVKFYASVKLPLSMTVSITHFDEVSVNPGAIQGVGTICHRDTFNLIRSFLDCEKSFTCFHLQPSFTAGSHTLIMLSREA